LKNDEATKGAALGLAEAGLRLLRKSPKRDFTFTSKTLAEQCETLGKAGIDDPLIKMLHGWAIHDSTRDFVTCDKVFREGFKNPLSKTAPGALRVLMLTTFAEVQRDAKRMERMDELDQPIVEAASRSLRDGSYLPEEEEILVENFQPVFREHIVGSQGKAIWDICAYEKLTEWERLMLTGLREVQSAWLSRGHDYANGVKEKGWERYAEHLAEARKNLVKAWEFHPERPEAAAEMVGIVSTGGGDEKDDARVWFDRAVAAQIDYMPAYRFLINGYLPRWNGSHPKMLALGMACAMTHRYDTEVPNFFLEALAGVIRETEEWRPLCENPLIAGVALALCKQRVQDAPTVELKKTALAILGIYGWACGDYKTAAEAFAQSPERFSRAAAVATFPFEQREPRLRGESAIFAAGLKPQWEAAENARATLDWDRAATAYEKILSEMKGGGADYAAGLLTTARFERDLHKGGWVRLEVGPKLAGWEISKGDWEATPEGVLINHGMGASAYIIHDAQVGPEFQLRGEVELKPEDQPGTFGVMLGQGFDGRAEKWIQAEQHRSGNGTEVSLLDRKHSSTVQSHWTGYDPSHSSFLITCHHGRISYAINGQNVLTGCQPYGYDWVYEPLKLLPDGHLGFGGSRFLKGQEMRIAKLEVRMLPADTEDDVFAAPNPKPPASAREITTPDQLFSYLEGTLWSIAAKPEGDEISTAFFQSSLRDFWHGRKDEWRHHHAMKGVEARTILLDGEQHTVKFNDDCTHFEITNWPDKKSGTQFGSLKFRPAAAVAGPGKPFDFTGTVWKRGPSTIYFKEDGVWHEDVVGQRNWDGKWKVQSDRDAVIIISDASLRHFSISQDGQMLILDIGWTWKRAQ